MIATREKARNVANRCAICGAVVMAHRRYAAIYCCDEHRREGRAASDRRKYLRQIAAEAREPHVACAPPRTLFEALATQGRDEDFRPLVPEPETATQCLPGTEEKMRVLAARIQRGEPLWHPADRGRCQVSGVRCQRSRRPPKGAPTGPTRLATVSLTPVT